MIDAQATITVVNRVVQPTRCMLVGLAAAAALSNGGTLLAARPLQAVTPPAITKKPPPLTLIAARQRGHWTRYHVDRTSRGLSTPDGKRVSALSKNTRVSNP